MTLEQWRVVEEVFHAARQRDPEDRDAFLAATCTDDVIRSEVRALLSQGDGPLLRNGLTGAMLAAGGSGAFAVLEGHTLGHYKLGPLLGAGSMGDVYRARDTVLGRDVAIKVLSRDLRDDGDWATRFQREARIVAALQHPNIATIHGVVTGDGPPALVLELVEGPTLAATIAAAGDAGSDRPGLPVAEALRIARQLAEALGAAHAAGVVHRDLKPANVTLTSDGLVKVLDFGLAQIAGPAGAVLGSLPPVETARGVVLGTIAYMSPEQARGQPVDQRTDVWAFGCIVFEMLAGQRAFAGASSADVLAAITTGEPDWARLPAETPAAVHALLRRCLAKPADRRPADVRASWAEVGSGAPSPSGTRADQVALGRRAAAVGLAAAVVAGLAAALGIWRNTDAPAKRLVRATIMLEHSLRVAEGAVAFSPDGRTIVYEGRAENDRPRLYRRRLEEDRSEAIAGTEGGHAPFFSPDGRWVGFAAGRQLKKVQLVGGSPEVICEIHAHYGFSWGEDGTIVFSGAPTHGLMKVPDSGGTPAVLVAPEPVDDGNDLRWPQALPGSYGVIYAVGTGPADDARIMAFDARTGARTELVRGAAAARLIGGDHLTYAIAGNLFAVGFDLDRLQTVGEPRLLAQGVAEYTDGAPEYGFSAAGDLVYVPGRAGGERNRLTLVDLAGRMTPLAAPPDHILYPRTSPDGQRIAYMVGGAKSNVWIYDVPRQLATRATFGRFHYPIWRPNGNLTMAEGGRGAQQIVDRSAEARDVGDQLVGHWYEQAAEAWTPDGSTLFYRVSQPDVGWHLWSLTPETGVRQPFIATDSDAMSLRVSPDGRRVLYAGRETDRLQIFVRDLQSGAGRQQASRDGATFAAWGPDGRRLYYRGVPRSPGDGLWVVDVEASSRALRLGAPRRLFDASAFDPAFDISADGRAFVMVQRDATPPPRTLQLALDALRGAP